MVRDQWGSENYRGLGGWSSSATDRPAGPPTETNHHDLQFGPPHGVPETRPIDVGRALREHCHIPAKHYFVGVITDDNQVMQFAGPGTVDPRMFRKFYNQDNFVRCMQNSDASLYDEFDHGMESEFRQSYPGRRRHDRTSYSDDIYYATKTRKRVKVNVREEDDGPIPVVAAKREIMIGNKEEVGEYYAQQFRNLQQTACKLIAKAWVKQVEPKKQSVHPYTGADSKAPDWWPKPWGTTKDEKVRHKEPDHLYKRERVHLLCHILRLVVEPNAKQHHTIKQLDLNVKKLHDSANEALTIFFNENKTKKPYLENLFNMARQEERFKREEIDAEHKVYVLKNDRAPMDNYLDEGDNEPVKAEDEHSHVSPPKTTAAASPHGVLPPVVHSQSPTRHNMPGPPFVINQLPLRAPQYGHTMPGAEQGPFMEDGSLGVPPSGQVAIPPTPHDASRRPSIFQSSADYQSSSGPHASSNMYPSWTSSTTAATSQPLYSFTQNSPTSQVPFVGPPIQSSQPQYIGPPVDGLPRAYDPGQGNIFNTGSFSQAGVSQQSADYNYSLDPRSVPGPNVKVDHLSRPPPIG